MEPITMKVINPGAKRSCKQDTQLGVGAGKRAQPVQGLRRRLLPGPPRGPCGPAPGPEPSGPDVASGQRDALRGSEAALGPLPRSPGMRACVGRVGGWGRLRGEMAEGARPALRVGSCTSHEGLPRLQNQNHVLPIVRKDARASWREEDTGVSARGRAAAVSAGALPAIPPSVHGLARWGACPVASAVTPRGAGAGGQWAGVPPEPRPPSRRQSRGRL